MTPVVSAKTKNCLLVMKTSNSAGHDRIRALAYIQKQFIITSQNNKQLRLKLITVKTRLIN